LGALYRVLCLRLLEGGSPLHDGVHQIAVHIPSLLSLERLLVERLKARNLFHVVFEDLSSFLGEIFGLLIVLVDGSRVLYHAQLGALCVSVRVFLRCPLLLAVGR